MMANDEATQFELKATGTNTLEEHLENPQPQVAHPGSVEEEHVTYKTWLVISVSTQRFCR